MDLEVLAESGTLEHVICRLRGLSHPRFIQGDQTALEVPWFIYLQVLDSHLVLIKWSRQPLLLFKYQDWIIF